MLFKQFVVIGECRNWGCRWIHPENCHAFLESKCRWGKKCKYLHEEEMIQIIVEYKDDIQGEHFTYETVPPYFYSASYESYNQQYCNHAPTFANPVTHRPINLNKSIQRTFLTNCHLASCQKEKRRKRLQTATIPFHTSLRSFQSVIMILEFSPEIFWNHNICTHLWVMIL